MKLKNGDIIKKHQSFDLFSLSSNLWRLVFWERFDLRVKPSDPKRGGVMQGDGGGRVGGRGQPSS